MAALHTPTQAFETSCDKHCRITVCLKRPGYALPGARQMGKLGSSRMQQISSQAVTVQAGHAGRSGLIGWRHARVARCCRSAARSERRTCKWQPQTYQKSNLVLLETSLRRSPPFWNCGLLPRQFHPCWHGQVAKPKASSQTKPKPIPNSDMRQSGQASAPSLALTNSRPGTAHAGRQTPV